MCFYRFSLHFMLKSYKNLVFYGFFLTFSSKIILKPCVLLCFWYIFMIYMMLSPNIGLWCIIRIILWTYHDLSSRIYDMLSSFIIFIWLWCITFIIFAIIFLNMSSFIFNNLWYVIVIYHLYMIMMHHLHHFRNMPSLILNTSGYLIIIYHLHVIVMYHLHHFRNMSSLILNNCSIYSS